MLDPLVIEGCTKTQSRARMVCSICRQSGHNRMTCYRRPNVDTASPERVEETFSVTPLEARGVIISTLKAQITELTTRNTFLARMVESQAVRIQQIEAPKSNKANIGKIQEILFTNKESIPDGIYLSLMNALVGK